jgi:hypothetical protein
MRTLLAAIEKILYLGLLKFLGFVKNIFIWSFFKVHTTIPLIQYPEYSV